jgi:hypothetical protein
MNDPRLPPEFRGPGFLPLVDRMRKLIRERRAARGLPLPPQDPSRYDGGPLYDDSAGVAPPKPPIDPAFVEKARQRAVSTLVTQGRLRFAEIMLESTTQKQTYLLIDMPDPAKVDRRDYFRRLGIKLTMDQANRNDDLGEIARASFAAEIWVVTMAPGDPPPTKNYGDDPRRSELLYVEAWDEGLKAAEGYFYVPIRDGAGKITDAVLRDGDKGKQNIAHSLLADLIDAYTVAHELLPTWKASGGRIN